jgi:hypothetical protein
MKISKKYNLKNLKPGVYRMSDADYFSNENPALSQSTVKQIYDKSYAKIMREKSKVDTKALAVGSLFHTLILEAGEIEDRFVICEKGRTSKTFKEMQIEVEKEGKRLVSQPEVEEVKEFSNEALKNKGLIHILKNCERELAVIGKIDDVLIKTKDDILLKNDDGSYTLLDLKTSSQDKHSPNNVMQTIFRFGYDQQLAVYREILSQHVEVKSVGLVFVDKDSGEVAMYKLGERMLERGLEKFKSNLAEFVAQKNGKNIFETAIEIDIPEAVNSSNAIDSELMNLTNKKESA